MPGPSNLAQPRDGYRKRRYYPKAAVSAVLYPTTWSTWTPKRRRFADGTRARRIADPGPVRGPSEAEPRSLGRDVSDD